MLKYATTQIVFQEFPNEISFAINISNCPHRCNGCHSAYLRENVGEVLDKDSLYKLIEKDLPYITCVGFMGGDADVDTLVELSDYVHSLGKKTGWYSGNESISKDIMNHFDYVKIGPYKEELGGLNSKTTNQTFYVKENEGRFVDRTDLFHK